MTFDEWADLAPTGSLVIVWLSDGEQRLLIPQDGKWGEVKVPKGEMPEHTRDFMRSVAINAPGNEDLAEELDERNQLSRRS